MKKIIISLVLVSAFLILSSCFFRSSYSNIGLNKVEVYYEDKALPSTPIETRYGSSQIYGLYNNVQKLNSPAPREYFYQYQLKEDSTVKIKFTFYIPEGYQFNSITMSNVTYNKDNVESISVDETTVVVTLNPIIVSKENYLYEIEGYNAVNDENKVLSRRFMNIGSGSYMVGFYFKFDNQISKFDVINTAIELAATSVLRLELLKPISNYDKECSLAVENGSEIYYIEKHTATKYNITCLDELNKIIEQGEIIEYYVEEQFRYYYQEQDNFTNRLITKVVSTNPSFYVAGCTLNNYQDIINRLAASGYQKLDISTKDSIIYEKNTCQIEFTIKNDKCIMVSISF